VGFIWDFRFKGCDGNILISIQQHAHNKHLGYKEINLYNGINKI